MPMWYDWQPAPEIGLEDFLELCPVGEYRVVAPERIPAGILSRDLLARTHSVLILCSGAPSGRIYVMLNLNRVDHNDIDQMPYAIAFDGFEAIPSGMLIQHGNYPGRTTTLPPDFCKHVAASGIYPLTEMPPDDAGSIAGLDIGSQEEALRLLVEEICVTFPEG